jgi:hypothetical protein
MAFDAFQTQMNDTELVVSFNRPIKSNAEVAHSQAHGSGPECFLVGGGPRRLGCPDLFPRLWYSFAILKKI